MPDSYSMRLDVFLNSSSEFKNLSQFLLSNFNFLTDKSLRQVRLIIFLYLLQYLCFNIASHRAIALRPVCIHGQDGGVGAL